MGYLSCSYTRCAATTGIFSAKQFCLKMLFEEIFRKKLPFMIASTRNLPLRNFSKNPNSVKICIQGILPSYCMHSTINLPPFPDLGKIMFFFQKKFSGKKNFFSLCI